MATILITLFAFSILQIAQTQRCNIDIGFILDDSGSITENGFRQEKDFVKKVTGRLHVSPSNTRVSVMTFSKNPSMRIYFKDKSGQDWNALSNNLDIMTHSSGRTNTEKALQLAKTTMFNQNSGARLGVPKVLLLLTDGFSQSSTGVLSRAAYALRHDGVSIIVIAAGPLVRRAELELIASRPVDQNIFQVRDMASLASIVARVSTQACKPVTCFYNQCIYNEWSKWSGSCNEVTRSRTVLQQIRRSKIVMGGCAGLNTKECVTEVDKKDIGKCLQWCKYVKCFWAGWGAWSASCGSVTRQRKMIEEPAVAQRKFCQGLPQRCYQKPQIETNNLKCISCDYVECKYTEWSKWSQSCGKDMVRKRTLQTIKKKGTDCTGKPKSCTGEAEQIEKKDELCECDAVKCVTQWSAWSATCGKATRTQTVVKVPIKVREEFCDKVTKDCPTTTKTEIDDLICVKTKPPVTTPEPSDEICGISYKPVGCFKHHNHSVNVLKKVLKKNKYEKGRIVGFSDYLQDIICRCATVAANRKLEYFGISSTGNCLYQNSYHGDRVHARDKVAANRCRNSFQRPCLKDDIHCMGGKSTVYAYRIVV